jgi:metal-responsive CopG/Arc/MetJ family transcriptional regulator
MTSIIIGVSLPQELVKKIDKDRGDITRSRFLQRMVEFAFDQKEGINR